jgi:RNA polymerase sigma-70 factor (ECF subfamily)
MAVPSVLRFRQSASQEATSDAALVAQARHDRSAFGLLYDRYVELVFRYCLVRLRDREEAEDATSLVFARALAALPTQRGGSFRSWLFSIAHNVVIDVQRGATPGTPLSVLEQVPAQGPSLEDQVAAQERREVVLQALTRLSDEQRRVVELRLAGLTGPEVAAALGRSHDSVRTTQRRALSRIRTLLGITPDQEEGRDVS